MNLSDKIKSRLSENDINNEKISMGILFPKDSKKINDYLEERISKFNDVVSLNYMIKDLKLKCDITDIKKYILANGFYLVESEAIQNDLWIRLNKEYIETFMYCGIFEGDNGKTLKSFSWATDTDHAEKIFSKIAKENNLLFIHYYSKTEMEKPNIAQMIEKSTRIF